LHKQLVGFDAWGALLEREAVAARENPQIYNDLIVDLARDQKRLIAENDYSVLLVDIGHRHPTLGIYSKSHNLRPWEHAPEELRGMSDLLHATHKAQGGALPCNEDWVYAPVGCDQRIPWHVLLRWRVNNPSGFEGGTDVYLHPISPQQMAEKLGSRLREIQVEDKSDGFRIVGDGDGPSGSLRYLKGS
jgi:galactose-1-phosphate uridylyltransferase